MRNINCTGKFEMKAGLCLGVSGCVAVMLVGQLGCHARTKIVV